MQPVSGPSGPPVEGPSGAPDVAGPSNTLYSTETAPLPPRSLFTQPKHPYTKALLSAIPGVDPNQKFAPVRLDGVIPNPANLPPGCRFSTRCSYVQERCKHEQPAWREIASHHMVSCHFAEKLD